MPNSNFGAGVTQLMRSPPGVCFLLQAIIRLRLRQRCTVVMLG